jgi:hypothetical protein
MYGSTKLIVTITVYTSDELEYWTFRCLSYDPSNIGPDL